MSTAGRVCDRCIRKSSVKQSHHPTTDDFLLIRSPGDLGRPHCSRCSEAGLACIYSTERRRPGPPRGTRRQRQTATSADPGLGNGPEAEIPNGPSTSNSMASPASLDSSLLQGLASQMGSQYVTPDLNEIMSEFSPYSSGNAPSDGQIAYPGFYLELDQERDLMLHFFDEVHAAIPLVQRESFLRLYNSGSVSRDLVVTIVTVTARVLGPISYWKAEDVDLSMSALLKATSSGDDSSASRTSLDQFRQECLLAYYEFHQLPGPPAWMRIGRLTRKAFSVGLNQIDNANLCSAFDASMTTEEVIEDWRYVWWCVFCLDSYSNITSGAPFIVDLESINTALVRWRNNDEGLRPTTTEKFFLPDDIDELWKTTQDIVSSGCVDEYIFHMITTTILRQAGNLLRLRSEGKRLPARIATLKGNLSTLRLALPGRYLNPARNVLGGESSTNHHMRLTNVLHLHMVRLITSMPQQLEADEALWLEDWQQCLETCQDIASVVEQWNSRFCSCVDPAICFVIFAALTLLHLHRRTTMGTPSRLALEILQSENMLLLFLEQFSSMWAVPKFLIQQFKHMRSNTGEQTRLTYQDVDGILSKFTTPLHPRILQSSAVAPLGDPVVDGMLDTSMDFSDVWSFNPFNPQGI
ncbi:hypothetical protein GGR56DRAFT_10728 [Xylariaceae sp. FL0804]|nr:hypothetical protein GGR56DRAFT_10728 [Xylariaceae sp. FL0804]